MNYSGICKNCRTSFKLDALPPQDTVSEGNKEDIHAGSFHCHDFPAFDYDHKNQHTDTFVYQDYSKSEVYNDDTCSGNIQITCPFCDFKVILNKDYY